MRRSSELPRASASRAGVVEGARPRRPAPATLVAVTVTALAMLSGCGEGSRIVVPTDGGIVEADTVVVEPESYRSTEIGETVEFDATVLDATGAVLENAIVSWSSSDPSVAIVGSAGVVTTFSEGATDIVARSGDASGSATLTVAPSIIPPPM